MNNNPDRERFLGETAGLSDADLADIYGDNGGVWSGLQRSAGETLRSVVGDENLAGTSDGLLYGGVVVGSAAVAFAVVANPYAAGVGALSGYTIWVWHKNSQMADDLYHNRPIDPDHMLSMEGAISSAAIGGVAGGAYGAAAALAPAWAMNGGSAVLAGAGAFSEGRTSFNQYQQGNYFQAAFHASTAGLSAYLGVRGLIPARAGSVSGVAVQSDGPFGTGVITVSGPGVTSVVYAGAGVSTAGRLSSLRGLTSTFFAASWHIGTPNALGTPGGPINPHGMTGNCVACVGAVLHNKLILNSGRTFINAHDVARALGARGEWTTPVPHSTDAINYFGGLRVTSTFAKQPTNFAEIATPGHYALFSRTHVIYGRVLPNGRHVLYDPQLGEVLTQQRAHSLLGTSRPEIHQIVPNVGR